MRMRSMHMHLPYVVMQQVLDVAQR